MSRIRSQHNPDLSRNDRISETVDTHQRAPNDEPRDGLPEIGKVQGLVGAPVEKGVRVHGGSGERRQLKNDGPSEYLPVRALPSGRKYGSIGARMEVSQLAAKKMLLPYMDKLSFIEIALAQVGRIKWTCTWSMVTELSDMRRQVKRILEGRFSLNCFPEPLWRNLHRRKQSELSC